MTIANCRFEIAYHRFRISAHKSLLVTRYLPFVMAMLVLLSPTRLSAAYTYYYSDSLTTINTANWYQNGTVTGTSSGLTATTTNGGSLISKLAIPDGTSDYEVKAKLNLAASGGTYVLYVRGSTTPSQGRPLLGATLPLSCRTQPSVAPAAPPPWSCIGGLAAP